MRNLIGISLIVCGFIIPHVARVQVSFLFFWPGFLILLSGMPLSEKGISKKWARIGLLFNVLASISIAVLELLEEFSLFMKLSFILNPAGIVFQSLFPEKMPVETMGDYRTTTIIFLNLIIDICLGVIIGTLISVQQKRRS